MTYEVLLEMTYEVLLVMTYKALLDPLNPLYLFPLLKFPQAGPIKT